MTNEEIDLKIKEVEQEQIHYLNAFNQAEQALKEAERSIERCNGAINLLNSMKVKEKLEVE